MGRMTLGASPAGLLLLAALALICTAGIMKAAAYSNTTVEKTTRHDTVNAAAYGDDTLNAAAKPASKNDARRALVTTSSIIATSGGSGGGAAGEKVNVRRALATTPSTPSLQVATAVVVGKTRLDFSKQVCVSVPKKARQKSATVWWKGGGDSSTASAGGQCAQVKFFSKAVCQGTALDNIANPCTSG
ncbi:unnamed protein product [Closterium sp. Naga37s-1]|nr:unnamed protein product [Closterium sp. Naga37s-1]